MTRTYPKRGFCLETSGGSQGDLCSSHRHKANHIPPHYETAPPSMPEIHTAHSDWGGRQYWSVYNVLPSVRIYVPVTSDIQ